MAISEQRLQELIEDAYEAGGRKMLKSIGLDDEYAVKDIGELRDLLRLWRAWKKETVKTMARLITNIIFGMVILGIATKLGLGSLVDIVTHKIGGN